MSNVDDRRDYGTFIPSFLDDFGLDMPCFRLYAHIARRAGSGLCWESIDKMAKTCQMNRKTAYKAFNLLQEHKLILVEKRIGQTSLITLTNHSVWIPIPKQVQVEGIPNQVQVKKKPIPNQVHPPIPNQVHPPIPNQVHKGIPSEVTPVKAKENINLPFEQKTDNLSDLSKPESKDLDKTPPIAPPAAPRNYAQEMSDRFNNKSNRFAPKGLDLQGFAEWHLGGKRNNWHLDLIAVAKVHLKKHEKPFGDGDAINFINAICMREDWAKFELFADEATIRQQKEQSQTPRSQQQPAPIAVQELTATAPPVHIRERFNKAS
jgi:hypothetical protein